MPERQQSQFNILQLLILTTLLSVVLSAAVHYRWTYYPSFILEYYQQSPPARKALVIGVVAMLPSFILAAIFWGVFRMPFLYSSYQELSESQQKRRNVLREEIDNYRRNQNHQSGDST